MLPSRPTVIGALAASIAMIMSMSGTGLAQADEPIGPEASTSPSDSTSPSPSAEPTTETPSTPVESPSATDTPGGGDTEPTGPAPTPDEPTTAPTTATTAPESTQPAPSSSPASSASPSASPSSSTSAAPLPAFIAACVNAQLKLPATARPTPAQLAGVTSLTCRGGTSLEGITQLPNLRSLTILRWGADTLEIPQLAGLQSLTIENSARLTTLRLNGTFAALRRVQLSGTGLTNPDLRPATELSDVIAKRNAALTGLQLPGGLRTLDLRGNAVANLNWLVPVSEHLRVEEPRLTTVSTTTAGTGPRTLTVLRSTALDEAIIPEGWTSLRTVSITRTSATALTVPAALTGITKLTASDNRLERVSLPALRAWNAELDVSRNRLTSAEGLVAPVIRAQGQQVTRPEVLVNTTVPTDLTGWKGQPVLVSPGAAAEGSPVTAVPEAGKLTYLVTGDHELRFSTPNGVFSGTINQSVTGTAPKFTTDKPWAPAAGYPQFRPAKPVVGQQITLDAGKVPTGTRVVLCDASTPTTLCGLPTSGPASSTMRVLYQAANQAPTWRGTIKAAASRQSQLRLMSADSSTAYRQNSWGEASLVRTTSVNLAGLRDLVQTSIGLVGINADGDLVRLQGTTPQVIGHHWDEMDQLAFGANLSGDKTQYLVARRSDGHLFRYPLAAGKVSSGTQIGHGFSKHGGLVGVGDLNGDGRADLQTIRPDGQLQVWHGTASATIAAGTVTGRGWAPTATLSVPGDLDGDGRKDLLDRRSDNTVWVYYGAKDGWSSPKLLLTGLPAGTQVN